MKRLRKSPRKNSVRRSPSAKRSTKRSRVSPKRLLEMRRRKITGMLNKSPKRFDLKHFEKHQVIHPKTNQSDTKLKHTFTILDNGDEPFVVEVYPKHLEVYYQILQEEESNRASKAVYKRGKQILATPFQKLFVGNNYFKLERYGTKQGNSLLVQLGNIEYLYIGSEIYSFNSRDDDPIVAYASPVGNSGVPYPYAIGKKYVYYMLNKSTLPIELLHDPTLGYDEMYARFYRPDQTKKFKVKIIQPRVF
jgi:hypothetical protein